jgi:ABC-type uncharacterized transport system permease subunit
MDKEKWLKIQLLTTRMETHRIRLIILPLLSLLIAIAAALSVGAILIIIVGKNPLEAYGVLFQEAIVNYYGFGNTLTKTTPLLLTSLGVLVALKAGHAIAFISRGSFLGILLTPLFFGALCSGANVMQRSADVPLTIVYAIQGLTILFIAISLALENKKFRT